MNRHSPEGCQKIAGNLKTIMTDPSCSVNPVSIVALLFSMPEFLFSFLWMDFSLRTNRYHDSRQGCVIPDARARTFLLCLQSAVATVAMALIAVLQKNLIRAVIAFAVSSVGLATLFFMLSSAYAAVLELTVGAGLVAVLFLVALILAGGEEETVHS